MKKIFTINNIEYVLQEATAIALCDEGKEDCRQNVLLETSWYNGEKFERIAFGYELADIETEEDFLNMESTEVCEENKVRI